MKKYLHLGIDGAVLAVVIFVLVHFLSGCATMPGETNQQAWVRRVATGVKLAAFNGTVEVLKKHPELRDGFEKARSDLADLEASTNKVDIADVVMIAQRFPVKQLESPEARLIVGNATILLQELSGTTDLSTLDLKPVVVAMRVGIEQGLK